MRRLKLYAPLLVVLLLVAVLGRLSFVRTPPPFDEGEVLASYIRQSPVKLLVEDRYTVTDGQSYVTAFLASRGGVDAELVERMWAAPQDGFPHRVVAECQTVTPEELEGFRRTTDFYGEAFRAHPGTQAIAWLSRPVASSDGQTAIFYADIYSAGAAGWSGMVVMKRVDGMWKLSVEAHLPTIF